MAGRPAETVAQATPKTVIGPKPPARPAIPPTSPRRLSSASGQRVDLVPDPHQALARAPAAMDRSRLERLRRGRVEPEARLDLHGMTAARAHAALTGFVLRQAEAGRRLLLVITGKGRSADPHQMSGRPGILRHNVPHWLNTPPLAARVLQIVPAHRRHGGDGAYYIYLRRHR